MASTLQSSYLLRLPQELVENILLLLHPHDVYTFSLSCRLAYSHALPSNQILWHNIFVNVFDDPCYAWNALLPSARANNRDVEDAWNWHGELTRRLDLFKRIKETPAYMHHVSPCNEDDIVTLLSVVETSRPCLPDPSESNIDAAESHNITLLEDLNAAPYCIGDLISSTVEKSDDAPLDHGHHQFSAGRPLTRSMVLRRTRSENASRLHTLYGLTELERSNAAVRGAARRIVYDWHLNGQDTDYGPFKRGGSGEVNWQILEAICTVIVRNLERCTDGALKLPQNFGYSVPFQTPIPESAPHDWARVTGVWLGTYSFLDYADLFHYNVGYRPGHRPALDDEPEACGDLMRLELKLDDSIRDDWRLRTNLGVCHDLPVLYFSGTSRGQAGYHRPVIAVRGRASLAPGAREVRWRLIISYGGGDQWQLEGVQPGGVRSSAMYGIWSHCDHEAHGPQGPFIYIPEELCRQ